MVDQRRDGRATRGPEATSASRDLVLASVPAFGAVSGTWWLLGLPASYLAVGLAVHLALAALVARGFPAGLPGPGLGAANRVTLARAVLAAPVVALAIHPAAIGESGEWWVIALSTAAMLLDGVDGYVARRTGSQSAFGARFDMELDAALIMALSLLVWRSGLGAWVLLVGLMRYAFVAASWIWPALGAELPPSLRRKAVCVVQGVVLLVALGPIIPRGAGVLVAAGGLALLTWSFAVDVRWALRAGGGSPDADVH
jgi:phosphatidylglycerophosphate synthase